MKRRSRATSAWFKAFSRNLRTLARMAASRPAPSPPSRASTTRRAAPTGPGDWIPGLAAGPGGARRYRLYRPPDLSPGERVPLLVMLHGCGQDAGSFAASTRMNSLARRERFLVLYPEQDRLASAQRCWNWYDTRHGRAQAEAALILVAVEQVCLLQPVDRGRIALAGLSAGAGMAALLATRQPQRFRAVVMHSGIAPGVADSTASALAAMRGQRLPTPPGVPADATEARWPPLLVIQGDGDRVVSPRQGAAAAQAWAARAGARETAPRTVRRGQRHPMTVTDYRHRGRTVATLVDVAGLGHAWSGGAAGQPFSDPKGPDASRLLWSFVLRQFRQGPAYDGAQTLAARAP